MAEISLGVVVDVVHPTPDRWTEDIHKVRQIDGVTHIELWMEHIPTASQTRQLQHALGNTVLTVHAPFVDISLVTRWPEYGRVSLARLQKAVRASQVLGAHVFTIHAGKFPAFESHSDALKRFADHYEELRSQAGNVDVAVENLKSKTNGVSRESVATRGDLRALRTIHPEVRLTPDVGHAIQNGDDPAALLGDCDGHIASVHVHDAVKGGRSHRCLGQGEARLADVALALLRAKPRYVTLELLTHEDAEASLRCLSGHLARVSSRVELASSKAA